MDTIAYRRRAADKSAKVLFALSALLVILPLFLIFIDLLWKGARELKWTLLTDLPHPVGEPGGGIANGILGTLTIAGLAMAGGIPVAVMSGIYLAEYGRGSSHPRSGSPSTRWRVSRRSSWGSSATSCGSSP
jgi:phosphate transport system permease protein